MALCCIVLMAALFCCVSAANTKINIQFQFGALPTATENKGNTENEGVQTALTITKSIIKTIGNLSKALGPVGSILSAILGFFASLFGIHSESPEMKLMKKEFGEINMKLDTITQELDLIKDLILDVNLKIAYISDENAILNGFHSLQTFVNELHNMTCTATVDCQRERLRIGERYLPYFQVSQNMDNIYRGAMATTTVFSEPILDHMNKTYPCDVPKIDRFTEGIIKLAFKEHQVTMVYNMLTGSAYSITNTLNNWMKRMYKLTDYSKNIKRHCLENIKRFMLKDIMSPKYQSGYHSNYVAANTIRNDLVQKYPWLDWIVMAFDTDKDTWSQTHNIDGQFWSFPGVNKGRRNIIVSAIDKGTFKTEVKAEIAEVLDRNLQYDPFFLVFGTDDNKDEYFNYIVGKMKTNGVWKYIRSFSLLHKEQNWNYAKDSNHYERFFEQTYNGLRLFITLKSEEERLFLKTDDDRASSVRCRLPCKRGQNTCEQCVNGLCDHYPYSANFFCDCRNYFHGERCEERSNISMATNLETMFKHTMTIPKLTDIYFEIKDVSTFIGSRLGNIQDTIHRLSTTVGRAFVQLHESLSKQFKMIGIITAYGEQIKSLQYFIELFNDVGYYNNTENDSGLHDLAEAVLGAQRYNGIRRWLHDFNMLINGTAEFTLAPEEPLLITYMDQYKNKACTQDYKDAIDNVWRQIMLLQQRGYMIWIQALHILNMPAEFAIQQYKEYTKSQIDTMEKKTCGLVIPGSESIDCTTDGYYLNERIELTVTCKPNYYLVGNSKTNCKSNQTFCNPCKCRLDGSVSQECEDQTGKCSCKDTNYGDKCENRNCTWSSWGDWSVCPRCGYANQTRTRTHAVSAKGTGTCYGASSETRPCFQGCCSNQFNCNRTATCIHGSQHCDNRPDCAHNEDESDCCETRYTPWDDNGGGDTRVLDRHHLDCGSPTRMITKFSLEASDPPQNQIRYMYVCCRFAAPFCSMRSVHNTPTESNEALVYLDKQQVDCSDYSVLNAFHLVNTNYKQQHYQYQCCDIETAYQGKCTSNNSAWTEEGSSKNFFLGRQDFQCDKGSYLSYFSLERNSGHNLIRYNYRCCFVYGRN